jgi:hypothetical protein
MKCPFEQHARKEFLINLLFSGKFETPDVVSYRNELFLNGLPAVCLKMTLQT